MVHLTSSQGSLVGESFESGAQEETARLVEDTTGTYHSYRTESSSSSSESRPPSAGDVEPDGATLGASSCPPPIPVASSASVVRAEHAAKGAQSELPLLQDRILFAALPTPCETGRSQTGLLLYLYTFMIIWQ